MKPSTPQNSRAWSLRPAGQGDLTPVCLLLEASDLSALGIEEQFGAAYVLAEKDGEVVGVAGMEIYETHGLLRSVAVSEHLRGAGLGDALVRDRLQWAGERGLESIYLLTLSADGFFARHGFLRTDRGTAPEEIRATKEFSVMCPSSAICMKLEKGGA
jgi:amino-acid N-acetyltransferase